MGLVTYSLSDDETSDAGAPSNGLSTAMGTPGKKFVISADDQVSNVIRSSGGRGPKSMDSSRISAAIRRPSPAPPEVPGQLIPHAGPSSRAAMPSNDGAHHGQFPDVAGPSRPRIQQEPDEEEARVRALLRPPPIDGIEDWGIPPAPEESCDPALVAKLAQFHLLKLQGKHFNDSLMSNKAFRNPHIYEKLVEFVDVDEKGTNYPKELWDPFDVSEDWYADKIAEQQKKRSEQMEAAQARGKRSRIDFSSSVKKTPEKAREKDRDRGKEKYEPYPPSRPREREEPRRSRWDAGAEERGRHDDDRGRETGRKEPAPRW